MAKTAEVTAAYTTFRDLLVALRKELVGQFDDHAIVGEDVINALAEEAGQRFNEAVRLTPTLVWDGVTAFLLARGVPVSQLKPRSDEPFSPTMLAHVVISEAAHAARIPVAEITRQPVEQRPRVRNCVQAAYSQLADALCKFAAFEQCNPPAQEANGDEPPELVFGSMENAAKNAVLVIKAMLCTDCRAICDSSFAHVPAALRPRARGAWVLLHEDLAAEDTHASSAALAALVARNYGAPAA